MSKLAIDAELRYNRGLKLKRPSTCYQHVSPGRIRTVYVLRGKRCRTSTILTSFSLSFKPLQRKPSKNN